jgi:hypothetical protein
MAGNRRVLDHMGSEEDGTRKKMAGNGGRERRAGRSWPGPLPLMLHITASRGASRWSQRSEQARFCFLGEGVRGLQFPRDSEGESKETQDNRFLHTRGQLGIFIRFQATILGASKQRNLNPKFQIR